MKRMVVWVMSALLALTCINLSQPSAIAAGTNLVKNGGFEEPDTTQEYSYGIPGFLWKNPIPGWQSNKGRDIEIDGKLSGGPKAYEGSQEVELDGNNETNEIYQDISTEAGKTYKLSFAFSPRPGIADNKLNVRWGDTVLAKLSADGTGLTDTQWQVYTYTVQAKGATTRLSFDNLNEDSSDGQGALLDAVSLEPLVCQLPGTCDVTILPDQTVSIPVTIQVPQDLGKLPLDLMLTQDLTSSYTDDLPVLKRVIPDVVKKLRSLQPDTTFGIATFTDKKVKGTPQYYVYKTRLPLTKNANAFQQAVGQFAIVGRGTDYPESSLSALFQVALRADSELKFRQGTRRVALVSTDDNYHKAGDLPGTPNNGDTNLNPREDYPSVAQVSQAMKQASLLPIFLVTSNFQSVYNNLVNQLGVGGAVVPLSADSSNLVSAIQKGLEIANQNLALTVLNDTNNYVNSVTPERFSNLAPGSEVTTTVNFKYSGKGSGEQVTLRAIGRGDLIVNVTVAL
ncbi:MAG: DUF642 domain-containing protein [Cyanobacteriota bacterium]|nr:DUF642 domain-containing protein [Cyanobacteriota bacterium]